MKKPSPLTKQEAGRLGGLKTCALHGQEHMRQIGRRGAEALWTRYDLVPVGVSGWSLVSKQTGEVKTVWNCASLLTTLQAKHYAEVNLVDNCPF